MFKYLIVTFLFLVPSVGFSELTCRSLFAGNSKIGASPYITDFLMAKLHQPTRLEPVEKDVFVPENKPAVEMILNESLLQGDAHIAQMAQQTLQNNFKQSDIINLVTEFVHSPLVEQPEPGKRTWGAGYTIDNFKAIFPADNIKQVRYHGLLSSLSFRGGIRNPYWIPYTPRILFLTDNNGLFSYRQSFLARATDLVLVALSTKMMIVHGNYAKPLENILHHDWAFHAARRFWGDISLLNIPSNDFRNFDNNLPAKQIELYKAQLESAMEREKEITLALDQDLQSFSHESPQDAEAAYFLLHQMMYEGWRDGALLDRALPASLALDIIIRTPNDHFTPEISFETFFKVADGNHDVSLNEIINAKAWLTLWWAKHKSQFRS